MPDPYKLGQMFTDNPGDWKNVQTATQWYNANIDNKRHFEEKTSAAYVMGTAEIASNVKFRAGVRWERTDTRAREFDPLTPAEVEAAGYAVSASTDRAKTIEGLQYQYLTRRSEEHTSELQSLMRISYAVFCLKKKNKENKKN